MVWAIGRDVRGITHCPWILHGGQTARWSLLWTAVHIHGFLSIIPPLLLLQQQQGPQRNGVSAMGLCDDVNDWRMFIYRLDNAVSRNSSNAQTMWVQKRTDVFHGI